MTGIDKKIHVLEDKERYVPDEPGTNFMRQEHLIRYKYASNFVKNKVVLDVACGSGYGCDILLKSGAKIVNGIDISEDAIVFCKTHFTDSKLIFKQNNSLNLDFPDDSFEVITCFEFLEHIDQHEEFMSEMKRVLKPNGLLIISTPNTEIYGVDKIHDIKTDNPFHLKELDKIQFSQLLKNHFNHFEILHQVYPNTIGIMKGNSKNEFKEFVFSDNDVEFNASIESKYFIGICSDDSINNPVNGLYLFNSPTIFNQTFIDNQQWIKSLITQNKKLEITYDHLIELQKIQIDDFSKAKDKLQKHEIDHLVKEDLKIMANLVDDTSDVSNNPLEIKNELNRLTKLQKIKINSDKKKSLEDLFEIKNELNRLTKRKKIEINFHKKKSLEDLFEIDKLKRTIVDYQKIEKELQKSINVSNESHQKIEKELQKSINVSNESHQKITKELQKTTETQQNIVTDIHQSFVFRALRTYDNTVGKIFPIKPKKYVKSTSFESPVIEQNTLIDKLSKPTLEKKDIICFPIINWDFRTQRPQHILSMFAQNGHRVFYFRTSLRNLSKSYQINKISDNIFEVEITSDHYFEIYKDRFNDKLIQSFISNFIILRDDVNLDPILFVQFPTWEPIVKKLKDKFNYKIIFDCLDEFTGFSNVNKQRNDEEELLLKYSDLVLGTSKFLMKKIMKFTTNYLFLPNAGDFNHFSTKPTQGMLTNTKKPIIGYFGSIAEWFDTELLEYLAKSRPDFSFIMIGHTFGSDIRNIQKLSNVKFLGERPYFELPKYLHDFDVSLIPFRDIPLIEATHPVKIYEYFASGKPVVSTMLSELSDMSELCYLAKNKSEFLQKLDVAVNENDENLINLRKKFSSENTWNDRFIELRDKLNKNSFDIEHHS